MFIVAIALCCSNVPVGDILADYHVSDEVGKEIKCNVFYRKLERCMLTIVITMRDYVGNVGQINYHSSINPIQSHQCCVDGHVANRLSPTLPRDISRIVLQYLGPVSTMHRRY